MATLTLFVEKIRKLSQTQLMHKILLALLLGTSLNGIAQETSFFNADGFFSIGTQSNRTASITLVDMDGDGDLDALVANGRHWAEQNFLFYNDGRGGFKLAQPIGKFLDASYAMKAADFNNDGFLDIAVANDNIENRIYFGASGNRFEDGPTFGSIGPSRNLEIADIDKDGDIDLILSNRKARNEICLNDGKGNFKQIISFGNEEDQTLQTLIADLNKDGFPDLITAERAATNKIYLNDGKLNFNKKLEFGDGQHETRAVALADFDRDGYPDIIAGNLGQENIIYYGGKNVISDRTFSFEPKRATQSIEVADLNMDGFPDIIEGNSEERNYVYLGQENGGFLEVGLREDTKDDTYHVTSGDLNSDGFPDIVEANSGAWNLYYRTQKK